MGGKDISDIRKFVPSQSLRQRTEEKLAAYYKPLQDMSPSEMSSLIHEMLARQVEQEMQNEQLRKGRAETEASRKAYQDLWDLSPVGYLIVDSAGRVTAVNRAAQRLFGRPETGLLNEPFSMLVTPEDQVPVQRMFEEALETGNCRKTGNPDFRAGRTNSYLPAGDSLTRRRVRPRTNPGGAHRYHQTEAG